MEFFISTGNAHKISEFKAILEPYGIALKSPKELGINVDVEENGATFAENALIKAQYGYKVTGLPAIADDSGLSIEALNGEPGIYSARYAGENAADADKINKVLKNMLGKENRKAKFVCAIAFVDGNNRFCVQGECHGEILDCPRGENGFGYDPIFMPDGFDKSFAQLSSDEKNSISHRGRALKAFTEEINKIVKGTKNDNK